ncbi:sulfatase-like hydrolase/transferase [Aquibacillus salsiterrae]|uniref:Sulfatase-like hydrolase/transferase n=1 Tax=Aquibacillus salsiterrae TaxID=2950439 RepID=A0A9X3WAT1_9BACI|nr:sulfatase-like hydrolase/transferase [Aquibacillus salsiterrae]MDC3415922.1 sulfatase-like hydrolase/transferase [Aquibacillus salsiterrae]
MKIIMISLDSLRANRLGCYGYHKPTSPYLDKIAEEGVLFENMFAADIPTEAVHTAIFTGKVGLRTGIVSHGSSLTHLPKSTEWLPTMLRNAGFTTGAVDNLYQLKEWFARGFRYYINSVGENRWIDGKTVNNLAKPWIKEHKDEDFFLFLHYWDPHTPYLPPKEYIDQFYDSKKDRYDKGNNSMDGAYNHLAYPFFKHHHFDLIGHVTDADYVNALYDAEVRYLDERLKELDNHLDDLGIKEDTLLVIFGDHGESLTEHDIYWDHCGLYDTTVRVPTLIRWPGVIPEGKRVKGLTQQVDLLPTILEAIEKNNHPSVTAPLPPDNLDGKSLWPTIFGEKDRTVSKVFLSECAWQAARGIRTDRYKFIRNYDSGPFTRPVCELYDITSDPTESHNLAEQNKPLVLQFEHEIDEWVRLTLQGKPDPLTIQLEKEGLPFRRRIEAILATVGLTFEEWKLNPSKGKMDELMANDTKSAGRLGHPRQA